MVHLLMIALHATAAALCFIFGALTLLPHLSHQSRLTLSTFYVGTLIAMIVFLAGTILAHVGQLEALQRGIFCWALCLELIHALPWCAGPHRVADAARRLVAYLCGPHRLHTHLPI